MVNTIRRLAGHFPSIPQCVVAFLLMLAGPAATADTIFELIEIDLLKGVSPVEQEALLRQAGVTVERAEKPINVAFDECRTVRFRPNAYSWIELHDCQVIIAYSFDELSSVHITGIFPNRDSACDWCLQIEEAIDPWIPKEETLRYRLNEWLDGKSPEFSQIFSLRASQAVKVEFHHGKTCHCTLQFEISTHFDQEDPNLATRDLKQLPAPEDDAIEVRNFPAMEFECVKVQPDSFQMGNGSPDTRNPEYINTAPVAVTITKPFLIQRTEVTQKLWKRVMQTQPWIAQENVIYGDEYPATFMTWSEANEFCQKLSDTIRGEKLISIDESFRLPTEAEWELSCRAGTETAYSFGDDPLQFRDYAWVRDRVIRKGESIEANSFAHRVATKKPNRWGLFDMHANVWEFCQDYYAKDLVGGNNPGGPVTWTMRARTGPLRVLRGGSWKYYEPLLNTSYTRSMCSESKRGGDIGFRVVLSVQ